MIRPLPGIADTPAAGRRQAHPPRRSPWAVPVLAATVGLLSGCAVDRGPLRVLQVASGLSSQWLCVDTQQSGLPLDRARRERVDPMGAMPWLRPFMAVQADADAQRVRTTVLGGFASQARLRDGWGCQLHRADDAAEDAPGLPPVDWAAPVQTDLTPGPATVPPPTPALQAALARAFEETAQGATLNTRAVLVVQHGRLLAERYAPGIGPQTPLLGFSMSKSLTHALFGILVRRGRLTPDQAAPVPTWSATDDPRRAITLDHLLRQTSGLAIRQDNSGLDDNARMLFIERDRAAYAASKPLGEAPGSTWAYTDANFVLLSRILRDSLGGDPRAVRDFAARELFGPLGMHGVTLGFDATGTPGGDALVVAPARDWARLGLLYLNDGVAGGRRLLPENWVRHARAPTLDTAYGAGWWTNARGGDIVPQWGVPWGFASLPRDAFFARGFMGQFTIVVPSHQLVIVRMGSSHWRGDAIEPVNQLVADVLAALPTPGAAD